MKKILILALIFTTLFQSTLAEKTSDNGLANALDRPNRAVKYGQCWVFSGVISKTADNSIDGLNNIKVTQTTSKGLFAIVIGLNTTKDDKATPLDKLLASGELEAMATITLKDCNGKLITVQAKFIYKGEKGECQYEVSSKEGCAMTIEDINISFTNKCKQTFDFNTKLDGKNNDETFKAKMQQVDDPCKTKFRIDSLDLSGKTLRVKGGDLIFDGNSTITISGGSWLSVDDGGFKKGGSNAGTIAEFTYELTVSDCKGNKKTIIVVAI